MILVTGATGNVGKHVYSSLEAAGVPVRGLSRRGPVRGDLTRPETLEPALEGVESVFLVWPGFDASQASPVIDLIAQHARRIVYLSAPGGAMFHGDIERMIRATDLNWTFLRPGGFAVNTLGWAEQVRQGVVRWPYGQAKRSLIHEKDIAAVAVHVLTSAGHGGATYDLTGPAVISQEEQVRTIGAAIGRDVRWEELSPETAREEMTRDWGNPDFVEGALRTWAAMVDEPEPVTDTVEKLLGRPALTFRQWAADHASDFA